MRSHPAAVSGSVVELLHADDALIVAVKPAGLLSVPGRHEADCLAARLQALVPDALVVHRLDMATSGLMLFARGPAMQRALSRAFAERRIEKRYAAVVHGRLANPAGEIDLPLLADWPNRPKQKVDIEHGRPSLTRYRVTGFDGQAGVSHLELEPVSGRAHQLRVHLQALGHPILGDALYAPEDVRRLAPRLLLHASRLALVHPSSGEALCLESPSPFQAAAFAASTSIR